MQLRLKVIHDTEVDPWKVFDHLARILCQEVGQDLVVVRQANPALVEPRGPESEINRMLRKHPMTFVVEEAQQ
jgi:hypothetical protein